MSWAFAMISIQRNAFGVSTQSCTISWVELAIVGNRLHCTWATEKKPGLSHHDSTWYRTFLQEECSWSIEHGSIHRGYNTCVRWLMVHETEGRCLGAIDGFEIAFRCHDWNVRSKAPANWMVDLVVQTPFTNRRGSSKQPHGFSLVITLIQRSKNKVVRVVFDLGQAWYHLLGPWRGSLASIHARQGLHPVLDSCVWYPSSIVAFYGENEVQ